MEILGVREVVTVTRYVSTFLAIKNLGITGVLTTEQQILDLTEPHYPNASSFQNQRLIQFMVFLKPGCDQLRVRLGVTHALLTLWVVAILLECWALTLPVKGLLCTVPRFSYNFPPESICEYRGI